MKTSSRAMPIPASSSVEQLARRGRRTARPRGPRRRPAPRRRTSGRRRRCPAPKTTCVRVCGEVRAALAAAGLAVDLREDLATLLGGVRDGHRGRCYRAPPRRCPSAGDTVLCDGAVTFSGRTPQIAAFSEPSHQTATGIPMGNWTDISPTHRHRRPQADWARHSPPRCAMPDMTVDGPHGRGFDGAGSDVVLLCVPDAEIAAAGVAASPRACSSATAPAPPGLDVLAGPRGLRPAPADDGARATARASPAPAARSPGTTRPRAATSPAGSPSALGMTPFTVADDDRAAYHAAAAVASNLLVALEADAERLAAQPRASRARRSSPLVRASVENWAARRRPSGRSPARSPAATRRPSPPSAPRSPSRAPELLALFDVLGDRARALAGRERSPHEGVVADGRRAARRRWRPRARAGRTIGFVPDDGRPARGPPRR